MHAVKLKNKLRIDQRTTNRHFHISFHNVLNHKCHIEQYITGGQKQLVYVKLNN